MIASTACWCNIKKKVSCWQKFSLLLHAHQHVQVELWIVFVWPLHIFWDYCRQNGLTLQMTANSMVTFLRWISRSHDTIRCTRHRNATWKIPWSIARQVVVGLCHSKGSVLGITIPTSWGTCLHQVGTNSFSQNASECYCKHASGSRINQPEHEVQPFDQLFMLVMHQEEGTYLRWKLSKRKPVVPISC